MNDFFDNVRKYWEVDEAINELKKYKSKTDVYKNNRSLYKYSKKNNLFIEVGIYNINKDNKKRCIYAYVDDINKVAYVGLTINKEERHETHKTGKRHGYDCKSSVYEYFKSINKEVPDPIYLEENLSGIESQKMEDYYRNKYESEGYIMLNKGKTGIGIGSLGGAPKWNDDNVVMEIKKYKSRSDFMNQCGGAYNYLKNNDKLYILDVFLPKKFRWSYDSVVEVAKKYKTRNEFRKESKGAYNYALRCKIIDILFPSTCIRWNDELVIEESKKYKNRKEFSDKCGGAYNYAIKHKLLDTLFPSTLIKWDDELVIEESKKYKNRKEFSDKCSGAYNYAYRHKMLDKLFPIVNDEWTEESVAEEAKKYKSRREFQRNCGDGYYYALKNDILDKIIPVTITKWNDELVIEEAKKYPTRNKFKKGNNSAYNYARRNNLLDKLYKK